MHVMRIGSLWVLLIAKMKTTSHLVLTKKRHLRHSYRLMMLPCQVRCCNVKAGSLHSGFHSRASTLCNGKTTCSIILWKKKYFIKFIQFQVYKHWGYPNNYIGIKIIDENFFVSIEPGFQTSWMQTACWYMVFKVYS